MPKVKAYALSRQAAQWVYEQSRNRRGTKNDGRDQEFRELGEEPLVFRNDSGETVPAYGIVRVTGATTANGRSVLTATKPATATGRFIVNGPRAIPDGKFGVAQRGPVVRVLYDSGDSPTNGKVYGVDGFKARTYPNGQPLTQVVIHGIYDSTDKVARATLQPHTSLLIKAPSGGIPGRVGALPGGATCDVLVLATSNDEISTSNVDVKVYNWTTSAACANGDRYGMADFVDGRWQVSAEDCNDEGSTVQPGVGSGTTVKPADAIDTGTLTPIVTIGVGGAVSWTQGATPIP